MEIENNGPAGLAREAASRPNAETYIYSTEKKSQNNRINIPKIYLLKKKKKKERIKQPHQHQQCSSGSRTNIVTQIDPMPKHNIYSTEKKSRFKCKNHTSQPNFIGVHMYLRRYLGTYVF